MKAVPFRGIVYLTEEDRYDKLTKVRPGERTRTLSGSEARESFADALSGTDAPRAGL